MDPMQEIEARADESVRRGCGFAGFGIFAVMTGLSFDPVLATESGAILTSLLVAALALKAVRAPFRSHRNTELWMLLDKDSRPPEPLAQRILMTALKETYARYARATGALAAGLWVCSLGLSLGM